ncbi:MAG: hypothetical protein ACRDH9_10465 [Actinomycetota bacterium]
MVHPGVIGESPIECPRDDCTETFGSRAVLEEHLRPGHPPRIGGGNAPPDVDAAGKEQAVSKGRKGKFPCRYSGCGSVLKSEAWRDNHERTQHGSTYKRKPAAGGSTPSHAKRSTAAPASTRRKRAGSKGGAWPRGGGSNLSATTRRSPQGGSSSDRRHTLPPVAASNNGASPQDELDRLTTILEEIGKLSQPSREWLAGVLFVETVGGAS